ncbi:hypothetical protein [Sphingomicrobium nitratireducens]|uniref:hypothetical protein n=1 Tax=Sphingomicrobium nitratireducens TaxID=2964666 RepID=UPI00223FCE4C|nr:hypothetical protein [Sphingomicrobium nitratireducens]
MPKPKIKTPKTVAIKSFWDGDPDDAFTFARHNWEAGKGARESISPKILAKRRPAAKEGVIDTAERVEVLLPADAPQLYADVDFLVQNFEDGYPTDESLALAQVTLRFEEAPNLHAPYEAARSWVRSEYVDSRGLPVILVLHAPFRKGSDNPPHAHAMVLPRRLTRFGWGKIDVRIGNDRDRRSAKESWLAWSNRAVG